MQRLWDMSLHLGKEKEKKADGQVLQWWRHQQRRPNRAAEMEAKNNISASKALWRGGKTNKEREAKRYEKEYNYKKHTTQSYRLLYTYM